MGEALGDGSKGAKAVTDWLLQLYHCSPYPLKVLAATAKGYYLRWWRYGPETERLVQEALERESWSLEKWRTWQEERLARVLHRAATQVPYYREQWGRRRRQGDRASWEVLEHWPVLEKEPLRQNPAAFVADGYQVWCMFPESTSGSTGTPLNLWQSRKTVQVWYALCEARWRRWYGVSRHDRWAILGGKLVAPVARRKPPFWVWNAGLNQLYLSSYHLAPDLIPHYLEALRRHRIIYLWGYPSSLYALAQEVLRSRRRDLPMTVVITNAEPIFDFQRQTITEAFQCPVRETYGMSEIVAAASECPAGKLHLWPEVGWVEVLADGRAAVPGGSGDLVCTGLLNEDMPLIRYRVDDRGALKAKDGVCRCGRSLPLLASIDGRSDDVLCMPDGRSIGRLDHLFKTKFPIREAQIIQEKPDCIRVRYVPALDFTPEAERSIAESLIDRLGLVDVLMEGVSEIPRGPNGKFRGVVCSLSEKEIARLRRGNTDVNMNGTQNDYRKKKYSKFKN
jgi:phenylacetate-CoA ligase